MLRIAAMRHPWLVFFMISVAHMLRSVLHCHGTGLKSELRAPVENRVAKTSYRVVKRQAGVHHSLVDELTREDLASFDR